MASLAALDAINNATEERPQRVKVKKVREVIVDNDEDEEERRREERRRRKKEDMKRRREDERDQRHTREKRRIVSGTVLERGSGREDDKEQRDWRLRARGGAASDAFSDEDRRKKRRKLICEQLAVTFNEEERTDQLRSHHTRYRSTDIDRRDPCRHYHIEKGLEQLHIKLNSAVGCRKARQLQPQRRLSGYNTSECERNIPGSLYMVRHNRFQRHIH